MQEKMAQLIVSLAAAVLISSSAVRAQDLPITDFDFRAAESRLASNDDSGGNTVPRPVRKSLHEAEQAPDGSRGYGLGAPIAMRVAWPAPVPPPFKTEREWETYYQYCGPDAIVRATHMDSTPVLTRDKSLIYTVSHFMVTDTIKSDVPFAPGQLLVAYRVGGSVADGGEQLRVETPDSAAFEPQKSYVLILRRDKNASLRQYFMPPSQTIAVTNDIVYPIAGKFAWLTGMEAFPSGSSYAAIRNTFAEVHELKACADAQ